MRVGIFGNTHQQDKCEAVQRVFTHLQGLQAKLWVEEAYYQFLQDTWQYTPSIEGFFVHNEVPLDLAISVGGDGTFLRTVAQIASKDIPIVGVNTGSLGFLADIHRDKIEEALSEIMAGKYRIEERSALELRVQGGEFHGHNFALNEIAVLKRDTSSMIAVHAYLNDDYLASYRSDGLIIATPTGSTAYSMSANGPIMVPTAQSLVISPIAPHSLTVRPLVIPDDYSLRLEVESRSKHFRVAVDGRSEAFLAGTTLFIKKAAHGVRVVKHQSQSFYDTLRQKLMWGSDNRNELNID